MGGIASQPNHSLLTQSTQPDPLPGATMSTSPAQPSQSDSLIDGCWELSKRIGRGFHAYVHLGINAVTGGEVAVKVEEQGLPDPKLAHEYLMYKVLHNVMDEPRGFARPLYYGSHNGKNVLVIDRLGPSLQDVVNSMSALPLQSTLSFAVQALERLAHMHDRNLLHRDVKPSNFVMGVGEENQLIYLIDFGLSKRFLYEMSTRHIPFSTANRTVGTAQFASINSHLGYEQSRRDDLESLGYTIVYLFKGTLPWINHSGSGGQPTERQICLLKQKTSIEELCEGMPDAIHRYFMEVKALAFTEEPRYNDLHDMLYDALDTELEQQES